mgnify:CR=1 FL=1
MVARVFERYLKNYIQLKCLLFNTEGLETFLEGEIDRLQVVVKRLFFTCFLRESLSFV